MRNRVCFGEWRSGQRWVVLAISAAFALWCRVPNRRGFHTAARDELCFRSVIAGCDARNAPYTKWLARLRDRPSHGASIAACFAPGTPDGIVDAFNEALWGVGPRYNAAVRWGATATGPQPGSSRTTLTYSFVPDGTVIPSGAGEAQAPSNLRAFLNGIYGNETAWRAIYAQMYARWSQMCNVACVYEPNDDGVPLSSAPGVLGVRGDIRLSGKRIDGNYGILAYNYYPSDGDMVIDTADAFFQNTANNSLLLRNTLSHESGHGLGLAHVCPLTGTKLMEPYLNSGFDGPQHDDLRGAQALYGDPFENNDNTITPTNLGTPPVGTPIVLGAGPTPSIPFGATLSVGGIDQDLFRFSLLATRRVTIMVAPVGTTYDDSMQSCSGQAASCCSGHVINSLAIADLAIRVIAPNGLTVLGTFNSQPAGSTETASLVLPAATPYFLRVYAANAVEQSQLYTLTMLAEEAFLPLTIELPEGPPATVDPAAPTSFPVRIVAGDDAIVAGSSTLHVSINSGAYQAMLLTNEASGMYTAALPPVGCDSNVQFYLSAEGSRSGVVTSPMNVSSPYAAPSGTNVVAASLDFESAVGWTVTSSSTLTRGAWERGVPAACDHGDPPTDFDFSGQCCVTGNSRTNGCHCDVDGGATLLTSPVYDLHNMRDIRLAYARWFSNSFGTNPYEDTMVVQVSSDGGATWNELETVGPTSNSVNPNVNGGWVERAFALPSALATSHFQVRFIVSDLGGPSVVEAAVDSLVLRGLRCNPSGVCLRCDLNQDGVVDGRDIGPFVDALITGSNDPMIICAGDVQSVPNGSLDPADVPGFVACVLAGG